MEDSFPSNSTSSSAAPNSEFHGDEFTEEMGLKCQTTNDKQNETQMLMAVDSSSLFDSSLPYDPITNYLAPRPKYLYYNPDRFRRILARQEKLDRILKGEEFPISDDESEESDRDEKTHEIAAESHGKSQEQEREVEVEDEVENDDDDDDDDDEKQILKVFLQYVLVMVALILTTLFISSKNSPPLSPAESAIHGFNFSGIEEETFCPMMLTVVYLNDKEINKEIPDVYKDELQDLQTVETYDDIIKMEIEETDDQKNSSDQRQEQPVILMSKKIESYNTEAEKDRNLLEMLNPMVDQDDCNNKLHENEIESKEKTKVPTKIAYFDPQFAAFSWIAVLIFATMTVLCYSMQTEISFPHSVHEVSDDSSYDSSFSSKSTRVSENHECIKDSSSTKQTKYLELQESTGDSSSSHGSFRIEKTIIRKQRNKTPEVTVSTVRRSSRIHNRSLSSSP